MKTLYYMYRNLHTLGFSIRKNGLVCKRISKDEFVKLTNVIFKVGKKSQQRARLTKQRNVHAFVAAETIEIIPEINLTSLKEITYNPFYTDTFIYKETKEPIYNCNTVIGFDGKLYFLN